MKLFLEMWKPRQAWLDLSTEERQEYISSIGPGMGELLGAGIELLGIGTIDVDTDQRANYDYWAVWQIPSDELVPKFENEVREARFYDYFEQINARGEPRSVEEVFGQMITAPGS